MLHTRWQRESGYVDEEGHPKLISAYGAAPSFEALCNECGLSAKAAQLLDISMRFGLCRQSGVNQLAYGSDTVLLTGHRLLMLARAVLTVERFLRTCLHNAKGKRQTAIADRTTQMNLSDEEFARVAAPLRRFLSSFIEASDRQLTASTVRDVRKIVPRRRLRMSGVTAFVFRDR